MPNASCGPSAPNGMGLRAPDDDPDALLFPVPTDRIQLRPRLVGLINEYQQPT
jgi:hypothetical protein